MFQGDLWSQHSICALDYLLGDLIKHDRRTPSYLISDYLVADSFVALEQRLERDSVLLSVHDEDGHGGYFILTEPEGNQDENK